MVPGARARRMTRSILMETSLGPPLSGPRTAVFGLFRSQVPIGFFEGCQVRCGLFVSYAGGNGGGVHSNGQGASQRIAFAISKPLT